MKYPFLILVFVLLGVPAWSQYFDLIEWESADIRQHRIQSVSKYLSLPDSATCDLIWSQEFKPDGQISKKQSLMDNCSYRVHIWEYDASQRPILIKDLIFHSTSLNRDTLCFRNRTYRNDSLYTERVLRKGAGAEVFTREGNLHQSFIKNKLAGFPGKKEYDQAGRLLSLTWGIGDREISGCEVTDRSVHSRQNFSYDWRGFLTEETLHQNDILIRKILYKNNREGLPSEETVISYQASGETVESRTFRYRYQFFEE